MATKTISISEEAYNKLVSMKKENESFSMVIKRVAGKKKLGEFFGVISEESANRLEKNIKEMRNKHQELSRNRRTKIGRGR